jgi:hypothetical protein
MAPAAEPLPPTAGTGWVDQPESAELLASIAERVGDQQRKIAHGRPENAGCIGRGQHQKLLLGAFGTLQIRSDLPQLLRAGPFAKPGSYRVACRISNGQPCADRDQAPDVRGVALKFFSGQGQETDLVMTNEGGRSHARNSLHFTDVADILASLQVKAGVEALRELSADMLHGELGPVEAARIAAILFKETVLHRVESMATEHYWGSVVKLGPLALKYSVHPARTVRAGTLGDKTQPNYLRDDLIRRLAEGPLQFELAVQLFADEESTPVNDASVAWLAPLISIGRIELARMPDADEERLIDRMAFNPGNGFEPLGMTHARKVAYAASARNRGALGSEEVRKHFM